MYKGRVLAHIGLWAGLYVAWVVVLRGQVLTLGKAMTIQFCYLAFVMGNYYWQLLYGIPRLLYRKKYGLFILSLGGGIVLAALLRVPIAMYIQTHVFGHGQSKPFGFGYLFRESLLNIGVWVVCTVAGYLVFERVRFRRYIDSIEREKTRTELDFLKAQFNPHFLFNSINSIYGHIDRKNAAARNMLLQFSDMLRYQLYECNVDQVNIEKEIHYLRNYVALQQVREGEGLEVDFRVGENMRGFKIAPLLFIAFVENAFKYVSHHEQGENRITLSLEARNQDLVFAVLNTKDNGRTARRLDQGGIGIANVRRRLELEYPGRYELAIADGEKMYEVTLQLKGLVPDTGKVVEIENQLIGQS